ncbi:ester cyclase [Pleomorphomonas diazotrophica]|uniref:Ester cyclase n=1 Tax=Pleomorphomonas diazotrophica TaxID=1166257 RepID=A0A1I4W472_9HYPH|nr:ester cyclase [Pleomorphomonas diazotrophica]PKR87852.1 ester cyclase [Pleomorphomonas diazotrophica]SFN08265.1 SnoaL-like polyketide cyclase [Pleomorphomonas diazotrophica]
MSDDIKSVVRRFNVEVIQNGNALAFQALMAPDFVNHAAPPGRPNGPESMWATFETVLRPAISELTVTIHDQIAEGDKVTTRKTICGRHTGDLLGVAATGRDISIDVIDIVRVEGGRYREHWGLNTLQAVLASLRA